MKKIISLLIFIIFISLGFNLYFFKNINSNNKIIDEPLSIQCNKAIKWEVSEKIKNTELYIWYFSSIKFLDEWKNTYLDFKKIKKWECDLISLEKNKKLCIFVKDKDLKWLNKIAKEWTFENILIKSFIQEKDNCSFLKNTSKIIECKNNFYDYMNLNNLVIDTYIWLSVIAVGREINTFWKENFTEKLNKEFLEKCNNLK